MTPKALMLLGAFAGAVGAAVSITSATDATVMLFAAGALFGKGYGIWEVRYDR